MRILRGASSRSPRLLLGARQPGSGSCNARCKSLLLPVVYITLGFLLAKCLDPSSTLYDASTRTLLHYGRDAQQQQKAKHDGWKTIQVYTGPLSEAHQASARTRFYSQARQDELVLALLYNKTNGYFIDLAANDAHLLSNTAALEHSFNWTGLCIEPNPAYWYNLTTFRPNCHVIAAVVGQTRDEQVYFRYDAGDHGGIADAGFDNGKRWQRQSQVAYTVPLLEILEHSNVATPHVIDYLSLDVEGAESFIMMQFPLDLYKIKIITAERLQGEIRGYLQAHGYEFVKRLSTWGESLWVHSEYKHELNMDAVNMFSFPIGAAVLTTTSGENGGDVSSAN